MTELENKEVELASAKDTFDECVKKIKVMETMCNSDFDFAVFSDLVDEALDDLKSEVASLQFEEGARQASEDRSDFEYDAR